MNKMPVIKTVMISILLLVATVTWAEGVQTVTPDEFFAAFDASKADGDGVIIDIRTPGEYDRGHAPGSLNIDYYAPDFADQLDRLDRSTDYFIYCNSGNRSGRSLDLFRKLGFESVYDLAGGWSYNSRRLSAIEE